MKENYHYIPKPVFDTLAEVAELYKAVQANAHPHQVINDWLARCFKESPDKPPIFAAENYLTVLRFLYSYRGSQDTFVAYRRELERLLQWSWFIKRQSITEHHREAIEEFVEFCQKPYKRWIALQKVARFQSINGEKVPHPNWRPFEAHVSKKARQQGIEAKKENYQLSSSGIRALFAILSSFYTYLLQEEMMAYNPVQLIRQKSKFIRKETVQAPVRRLTAKQWQSVLSTAKAKAKQNSAHERAVFILSCLYGMYLRISELVATSNWTPTTSDFFKDGSGSWWFRTVGKGNKARQIAVSNDMLEALIHYRTNYLKLSPLPTPDEKLPLIPYLKNPKKPISSAYPIRQLVQKCFNQAIDVLQKQGEKEEADALYSATVHWLRHTGISEDVKHRPREHVRDDAGHSSGATTDRYIDVELQERAKSAKDKMLDQPEPDEV